MFHYIWGMKEITQYDTIQTYFLDEEGYLYGRCGKMKGTTIHTKNGTKQFTRDKLYAIVYLGAPIDKSFYTKRVNGKVRWTLQPNKTWVSKNWYVPEYDDFRTTYIYYLCDSRNGIPKYIGKTINPKKRISSHHQDVKTRCSHKTNWIESVIKSGGKVEMVIIDEVVGDGTPGSGDWTWVETYWGNQMTQWGFPIIFDGGWGTGGMKRKLTNEEKEKHSKIQQQITGKTTYLYHIYKKEKLKFGGSKEACRYLASLGIISPKSEYTLQEDRVISGEFLISYNDYTFDEIYSILSNKTNWDMKVLQFSMDFSEVIAEYNTAREAVRKNNCVTIFGVLDKNQPVRKSSIGYRWVYKLDYVYLGIEEIKKMFNYKNKSFLYTKQLVDDCLSMSYKDAVEKYRGIVSHGTIGNIRNNPEYYKNKIGMVSTTNIKKIF